MQHESLYPSSCNVTYSDARWWYRVRILTERAAAFVWVRTETTKERGTSRMVVLDGMECLVSLVGSTIISVVPTAQVPCS